MFVPIPDNPLHLASSSKKPLFLLDLPSPVPSPVPSPLLALTPLQKKSSLKSLKDDTPNSNDTKHTVRWSSPLSISRMIPYRESDLNPAISAQTTSIPWSISQSLALNECTQCEAITFVELDSHFPQRERKGSGSVLSLPRPKALLTQSEELHARMNLMHLQKVILPKRISLSISITPKAQSPKHPSKGSSNAKTSWHRVTGRDPVFRPATINIPRPRLDQYDSSRFKRRSTTPDHKHPRKVAKTDENTSATASRGRPPDATAEELRSLKPDQSLDVGRNSSAEPPTSSDDEPSYDNEADEVLSDDESLFGDHEVLEREVPIRNDVTTRTRGSQPKNPDSQTQGPRRPLNTIKVVNWTNGLKRFQYLLQNKKMDWRCDDELYEFLKDIDVEKDNITVELLKKTQVGKMIRDLSKCGNFEERSTILARRIYKSWRKMCRAVE